MNYAICNETFQGWDWDKTCHAIAELGYSGVEVAPYTLAADVRTLRQEDRANYANAARRAGLDVVGLHWLLVSPGGLSLTGEEEAIRHKTAEYLAALVDLCADLGGKIMV